MTYKKVAPAQGEAPLYVRGLILHINKEILLSSEEEGQGLLSLSLNNLDGYSCTRLFGLDIGRDYVIVMFHNNLEACRNIRSVS